MTDHPDTRRVPVGVLAERRPGVTAWSDEVWRIVDVLEQAPDLPAWTLLRQADGRALFFAGQADVMLHTTDTDNLKHNIESTQPSIWVVLRAAETSPGMVLHHATVDAGEVEAIAGSGSDLMESLPMPPWLLAQVQTYVAQHHRERGFWKRRRDGGGDWRQKRQEEEE
ncbi:DUF3305 domain-containing protein [Humitalea sp. 24SJ18S-53]|uniref:DUF3305 domain-containing protein n=1 Tax=Humitalea sp. 24SJ18S-53 TaxID=3422307 RepID=UPI003D674EA6